MGLRQKLKREEKEESSLGEKSRGWTEKILSALALAGALEELLQRARGEKGGLSRLSSRTRPMAEEAEKTILEYRKKVLRDPTAQELASRLGVKPGDRSFQQVLETMRGRLDWEEPDRDEIKRKREEAQRVLQAALAMKYDSITNEFHPLPHEPSELKAKAEDYMEENRELLEKLRLLPGRTQVLEATSDLEDFLKSKDFRSQIDKITSWEEFRKTVEEHYQDK